MVGMSIHGNPTAGYAKFGERCWRLNGNIERFLRIISELVAFKHLICPKCLVGYVFFSHFKHLTYEQPKHFTGYSQMVGSLTKIVHRGNHQPVSQKTGDSLPSIADTQIATGSGFLNSLQMYKQTTPLPMFGKSPLFLGVLDCGSDGISRRRPSVLIGLVVLVGWTSLSSISISLALFPEILDQRELTCQRPFLASAAMPPITFNHEPI